MSLPRRKASLFGAGSAALTPALDTSAELARLKAVVAQQAEYIADREHAVEVLKLRLERIRTNLRYLGKELKPRPTRRQAVKGKGL
jgi:hypothetical protein